MNGNKNLKTVQNLFLPWYNWIMKKRLSRSLFYHDRKKTKEKLEVLKKQVTLRTGDGYSVLVDYLAK